MMILNRILRKLNKMGVMMVIPDKPFLMIYYKIWTGDNLNLKNPQTFCEKIQWLKLYYHNPKLTEMTDKYTARDYIERTIGAEYLIPLFGVWDNIEDIDIKNLPNKFVIKPTHDSGSFTICSDKNNFDWESVKKKLEKSISNNYYYFAREWSYKNVKPRIIAEELLEDKKSGYLKDYKFFCFNGQPQVLYVTSNRGCQGGLRVDFFDLAWNHLNITHNVYPQNEMITLEKPDNFDQMISLAKKLSAGLPFVRVDMYNIDGKIYAGELTFYPDAGYRKLIPDKWNYTLGDLLELPEKVI